MKIIAKKEMIINKYHTVHVGDLFDVGALFLDDKGNLSKAEILLPDKYFYTSPDKAVVSLVDFEFRYNI